MADGRRRQWACAIELTEVSVHLSSSVSSSRPPMPNSIMTNRLCSGKRYVFRPRRPAVKLSTCLDPRRRWWEFFIWTTPWPCIAVAVAHSHSAILFLGIRLMSAIVHQSANSRPCPFGAVTLCQTALRAKTDGRFLGREGDAAASTIWPELDFMGWSR